MLPDYECGGLNGAYRTIVVRELQLATLPTALILVLGRCGVSRAGRRWLPFRCSEESTEVPRAHARVGKSR